MSTMMTTEEWFEHVHLVRWRSATSIERYFINRRRRKEGKPPFRS